MLTRRLSTFVLLIGTMGATRTTAQDAPRIALGFGVDTTSSPNQEIFSLWRRYVTGPTSCGAPNPLWSVAEQARWPMPDLLCSFVYQGFPALTVVHLAPAVGLDSTYLVRTLISRVSGTNNDVRPLALYRVYMTREQGRWVLANALPRLTTRWHREQIGRITFVFPPTRAFDRVRAAGTAGFVDSLAAAFEVSPPASIEYVFTDDLMETLAAAGLEFFPLAMDTVGGRSQPANNLVFVGSSANGEGYRHEVAHVVLSPFLARLNPASLVQEGLMTWTGGSAGLEFAELMPALQGYLASHRELTLEGLLSDPPLRTGSLDVGYSGLAVLCLMVHDMAGLPGLRTLANAGPAPDAVVRAAAGLLGIAQDQVTRAWRARVEALASRALSR